MESVEEGAGRNKNVWECIGQEGQGECCYQYKKAEERSEGGREEGRGSESGISSCCSDLVET